MVEKLTTQPNFAFKIIAEKPAIEKFMGGEALF